MVKFSCKTTTAGVCFGLHCGALGYSHAYADGDLVDFILDESLNSSMLGFTIPINENCHFF